MNICRNIDAAMEPWVDSCKERTTLLLMSMTGVSGPDGHVIPSTLSHKLRFITYWMADKKLRIWWIDPVTGNVTFDLLGLS